MLDCPSSTNRPFRPPRHGLAPVGVAVISGNIGGLSNMMPVSPFYGVFGLFLISCAVVRGRIFTPCELAQELHRIIDVKYLYREIPLLVCVAGLQSYDTEYHSKQLDGSYYAGIFGIHSSTIKWMARYKGNLTDDDIFDDLSIFSNHVLQIDSTQRDDTVYEFYQEKCSGANVERIPCYLNPYVTSGFIVFNPKGNSLPGRAKRAKPKKSRN